MYGADPEHFHFGTKTGCRLLFQEERVPHPIGRENLTSLADAVAAITAMRAERPGLEQVLLKLNEGVSGEGNAKVDLRGLPALGSAEEAAAYGIVDHVATSLADVRPAGVERKVGLR